VRLPGISSSFLKRTHAFASGSCPMSSRRLLSGSPASLDALDRPLSPPATRAGFPFSPVRTEEPERCLDLPALRPLGALPAIPIGPPKEWPAETGIPDLLSSADVEQIFARSARTLHRWERRGHLIPVRVGHAKFYRAEDIRRLVRGQLEAAMRTPLGAATGPGSDRPDGKTGGQKMP
jgi:MerR-like DNA binding protein